MPIVSAKVVTIIAGDEVQPDIETKLQALGVRGWSFAPIKGHGTKGDRLGGWIEGGDNLVYTIITSEAVAMELLAWVTDSLSPISPSVAYAVDAMTGRRAPQGR